MSPRVSYHALWLLSERDGQAKRTAFGPSKNLIVGGNETGKSRVLKHVVWALGCEPTARLAGSWDANTIAGLELSVERRRFTFLRMGTKARAAFDANGKLLIATESASTWSRFFGDLFNYPLTLPRHKEGQVGLAGPDYAVLPYYIDQEGGWGTKWAAFTTLTQFADWPTPVFESFVGLHPPGYFVARMRRTTLDSQLKDVHSQQKTQLQSFKQVASLLPEAESLLDEQLFADELRDITEQMERLVKTESNVRRTLADLAQKMQERSAELHLALSAERDLVGDLAYLADMPDGDLLTCPTCGQIHKTSFAARLTLAGDAQDAHQLVVKIRDDLEKLRSKELEFRSQHTQVSTQLEALGVSLTRKKEGTSLNDFIAARSRATLSFAFEKSRRDLAAQEDEIQEERKELNEVIDAHTDSGREGRVREAYRLAMAQYAAHLQVAPAELTKTKIGARPRQAAGSTAPRVYLAMHMALIDLARQYGNGPRFPFIVDTPRQQGLDDVNTARLLDTVFSQTESHQIIVANESLPKGWQPPNDCQVIQFKTEKRRLLEDDEFREVATVLGPLVKAMKEGIALEREANRSAQVEEPDGSTGASSNGDEHGEEGDAE
jgi:rubrerythrin